MHAIAYTVLGSLGGVVTTVLGVWAKRRYARIDLETRQAASTLDAQGLPNKFLMETLARREGELAELRAQDRADRVQHAEALQAIKVGIEAIANRLNAAAEEARENAKVTNERLLVIETQLGIRRSA